MSENKDNTQNAKADERINKTSERLWSNATKQIQETSKKQVKGNNNFRSEQHRQFSTYVESLVNAAQQQQMSSEQQIRKTLNNASTSLMDSKRLESLYNNAQQLLQSAQLGFSNLQVNMAEHKQLIEQMEKECHEQQVATDIQAIQAMQQAISSMAQAQSYILQSQAVSKMFNSINQCERHLAEIEKSGSAEHN